MLGRSWRYLTGKKAFWRYFSNGPKIIQETIEKIVQIKEWLKVVHSHQKSYADMRRNTLEFEVRDHVLLKVAPWKVVIRFGK